MGTQDIIDVIAGNRAGELEHENAEEGEEGFIEGAWETEDDEDGRGPVDLYGGDVLGSGWEELASEEDSAIRGAPEDGDDGEARGYGEGFLYFTSSAHSEQKLMTNYPQYYRADHSRACRH